MARLRMKHAAVASALMVAALSGLVVALIYMQGWRAQESLPTWPAITMKYEATGNFHAVGENPPVTSTIGFRLTHQANGDWKEEIISAPDVVTKVGTFNRTGSYQQVVGNTYTRFDIETGETHTETIPPGHTMSPRSMILPMPLDKLDENYTRTPVLIRTGAKVCFNNACEDNAQGWLYVTDNGGRYVFADDTRGIPISLGHLNITDVIVASDKNRLPARMTAQSTTTPIHKRAIYAQGSLFKVVVANLLVLLPLPSLGNVVICLTELGQQYIVSLHSFSARSSNSGTMPPDAASASPMTSIASPTLVHRCTSIPGTFFRNRSD